ncbi:hypothetical protein B9Q17_06220 [Marinobacter vinifirmus]|uniref:Uncharacterized protein n=1 Tax=Marinobacter vinifirmus TaxID=355591 RepID=A0A7Z1DRC1_9GAMM|nr:hypothetical protein [Marinobacter vinifirmus]OZC34564.1 hypothetical protein B9Q17_06220 [Marinobacter vinifirmus]
MAGGQAQGRRPAGAAVGRFSGGVIRQGRQVITRNSSVRVGAGVVWQLAEAGSPGAGLGPAVWLVVKFKAGGRQGAGVGRLPRGVIRQRAGRQQGHGLGVHRVGVSARVAGHHQEPGRSVGGDEVWQLAAAGSPGAGLGPVVWLAVRLKAGGRQGLPWAGCPGGVIRQRQQGRWKGHGLGVSARVAGEHQEQQRSGWW